MEQFKVYFKKSVEKDFQGIPKSDLQKNLRKIQQLQSNPRPNGSEKLTGQERYRILSPSADPHRLEALIDELSWGFELHETFALKQYITFKLRNAGHILGSCFILFTFPDHKSNGSNDYRVIFSGDLGCNDTLILPELISRCLSTGYVPCPSRQRKSAWSMGKPMPGMDLQVC